MISFALAQVGDAYVWGGDGPSGWDCSGLVARAYAEVGVWLPHQSEQMRNHRRVRIIGRGELRPGDLVWPNYGHVAIYLGAGRIVHAANEQQGVRVDPLYGFIAGGRVT